MAQKTATVDRWDYETKTQISLQEYARVGRRRISRRKMPSANANTGRCLRNTSRISSRARKSNASYQIVNDAEISVIFSEECFLRLKPKKLPSWFSILFLY